ncbi:hypothetical protein PR002_g6862 [Phytophthora rubi]|uniref:Protein kinase domain-containing protein n=1 Tax=Phytophthora rubi TaxID=129364 RepID=A0A6A3MYM6_9STRA|nr:hypothetical protein PR002_g6862 [Phytophthora rubi]
MTIDRLGDYLVALRNDFVINHPVCRRGLNLRGQLGAYESETRVLFKLAATGRVVDILLRFGRVVESYVEVMGLEKTAELIQWREQLSSERQERVHRFRQILSDEQRLLEAMGDDTQQMELLTLLKHDMTMYHGILTPEELDVMSDVYDEVVRHSEFVLVGEPPSWFLSPHDLLCENGSYYLDAVRVSKCTTGDVFQTDSSSWEDQEEACLRQATVWADLNHPHVAKMFGACHIGNEPFIVHEPAEPLALNRSNAQSWEPLLGWALGLQYLHERELGYKSFDDNRLLARHHSTASGVLSGLGLVPIKRQTSASLQRSASNTFNMVALSDANGNVDDNRHESHMPTWSVVSDIFALGLAIYNTRQWVSMYGNEKVLVLPQECPQFLSERGWDLVGRMCARKPDRRASMWYVLHQLQAFVSASATGDDDSRDEHESYNPPNNIDDFIVRKMNVKVVKAMPRLQQKYKETPGTNGTMLEHVIDRLAGLHAQLQSRENIEEGTTVMEGFVGVLDMFYDQLTRRDLGKEQSSSSVVASFCASRAAAQKVAIFHHEIDRLLTLADLRAASAPAPTHVALADVHEGSSESIDIACDTQDAILDTRDIHDWQLKWSKARREQLRSFQACLKDTEELKRQLSDPKTRLEAQMLLQFELHKRRSSYPNSVLEVMSQALLVLDTTGGSSERLW